MFYIEVNGALVINVIVHNSPTQKKTNPKQNKTKQKTKQNKTDIYTHTHTQK